MAQVRGHRDEPISEARDRWINCEETYADEGEERISLCKRSQKLVDRRWAKPRAQFKARVKQQEREEAKANRTGRPIGGHKVYQKNMVPIGPVPAAPAPAPPAPNAQQLGRAAAQVNQRRMVLPRGVNPRALQNAVQQAAQARATAAANRLNCRGILLAKRLVRQQRERDAAALRQQARNRLAAARQRLQQRKRERANQAGMEMFGNPLMNSP